MNEIWNSLRVKSFFCISSAVSILTVSWSSLASVLYVDLFWFLFCFVLFYEQQHFHRSGEVC